MMWFAGFAIIFALVVTLLSMQMMQIINGAYPVVRPRVEASWPMGVVESFTGGIPSYLQGYAPDPKDVSPKSVCDLPGASVKQSFDLLPNGIPGVRSPIGPTSEQCYGLDFAKKLELGGTYRQSTNNYKHNSPESCSAPDHDMVLTFYNKPVF